MLGRRPPRGSAGRRARALACGRSSWSAGRKGALLAAACADLSPPHYAHSSSRAPRNARRPPRQTALAPERAAMRAPRHAPAPSRRPASQGRARSAARRPRRAPAALTLRGVRSLKRAKRRTPRETAAVKEPPNRWPKWVIGSDASEQGRANCSRAPWRRVPAAPLHARQKDQSGRAPGWLWLTMPQAAKPHGAHGKALLRR
jgi:hypothetical protein